MKDFSQFSDADLNKMDKHVLITIIRALQGQLDTISSQLNFLTEQIAIMNQRSFGRKTEKLSDMGQFHQMSIFEVLNEPEVLNNDPDEPEITEIIVSAHSRKKKSKREDNLEGLPARIFEHKLSDDKLS